MIVFCNTKASLYQTPHRDPIQKLPTRLTVKTRAQVSLRINEQILRCCFKLLTHIIFTERGGISKTQKRLNLRDTCLA